MSRISKILEAEISLVGTRIQLQTWKFHFIKHVADLE